LPALRATPSWGYEALSADSSEEMILYRNVYRWFTRQERGLYALAAQGQGELGQYAALAERYRPAEYPAADGREPEGAWSDAIRPS
jgi:hypothetical protein